MIGQSNHETQAESRADTVDRVISLNKLNKPIQVNSPRMDMHILEAKYEYWSS